MFSALLYLVIQDFDNKTTYMRDKIWMTKYVMYHNHSTNFKDIFYVLHSKNICIIKLCLHFLKLIACCFDLSLLNKIEISRVK